MFKSVHDFLQPQITGPSVELELICGPFFTGLNAFKIDGSHVTTDGPFTPQDAALQPQRGI